LLLLGGEIDGVAVTLGADVGDRTAAARGALDANNRLAAHLTSTDDWTLEYHWPPFLDDHLKSNSK